MYTLCIGGIILVALMALLKKTKENVSASPSKTSWNNFEKRQRDIQLTKEKVAYWGFPTV